MVMLLKQNYLHELLTKIPAQDVAGIFLAASARIHF
jgi:hypothetical protein